jgi:hypothetical protein
LNSKLAIHKKMVMHFLDLLNGKVKVFKALIFNNKNIKKEGEITCEVIHVHVVFKSQQLL